MATRGTTTPHAPSGTRSAAVSGASTQCSAHPASRADAPITVYTVNYPLQYFAERIAGKHADVVFPAPDGVDPAFWTPDSETVNRYQQADLILLNGAGYAGWTQHASLPRLKQVDTSAAFSAAYIRQAGGAAHSHGPGTEVIDFVLSVAAFIVAIGVLVSVHEFGHFWVARRLGFKVIRFSVGFGRPLLRWRGREPGDPASPLSARRLPANAEGHASDATEYWLSVHVICLDSLGQGYRYRPHQ